MPRILRHLQTIRIGRLKVGDPSIGNLMTKIPKEANDLPEKRASMELFATLPAAVR